MSSKLKLIPLVAAAALSGCAVSSYCEGEQDYQKAQSVPALKSPEGLTLPESPSALRIPRPPANPVPYGETYKDEDGDERVACLDKPPAMPPPAESAPPASTQPQPEEPPKS